jgi:hypothetical protein
MTFMWFDNIFEKFISFFCPPVSFVNFDLNEIVNNWQSKAKCNMPTDVWTSFPVAFISIKLFHIKTWPRAKAFIDISCNNSCLTPVGITKIVIKLFSIDIDILTSQYNRKGKLTILLNQNWKHWMVLDLQALMKLEFTNEGKYWICGCWNGNRWRFCFVN